MLSVDTPITVAPSAFIHRSPSAKLCASIVQPCVKAAGKKYSTTGLLERLVQLEGIDLPPARPAC